MKLTHNAGLRAARALGLGLLATAFAFALVWTALAQGVGTTTVQGTVYLANGQPGSGTLQVSWPAFTTSNGLAVTAGHINATIGADGFVSVNLAPNLGAMPAGLFYTAIYHLSDGATSTEYWVVPAAATATIASVRAQVLPAAQAVQAASKAYVDQAVASLTGSLSPVGGTLSGPLYLSGDPTQPLQAADKHYVDASFANALPLAGGAATGPLTATQLGAAFQVDQFPGADIGAKLQACLAGLSATYGGTCDARNFTGTLSMAANVTISTANATVLLPCATISTASQFIVTAGTRNVALRGCALRGSSAASGNSGGTVFLYSGAASAIQVGDPAYAADTQGFHLDNAVIGTTAATSPAARAFTAYRTQELDLQSLYLLGNSNQTAMTLDGTGNYTGGTFYDIAANGFQIAINGIGHQAANAATTDWLNASAFIRLHVDCPTSGGSPIAGTVGINLAQGDGNTFTGGDVEGCATALHLGLNAQNNTIVGLRNENSTNQIVADTGSAYNNWITGGTIFTGKLTDNGTHNSFLDTFHRTFNGIYGDWYASQQDATLTNHFRIGTGIGNERGLLNRYQTDYGYRWTTGITDAAAGEQFYEVLDELGGVNRLSIGQYLAATANTVTNVVLNSGGCYSSNVAPTLAFSGGGGTGAAGTANMVASQCSGGFTVASVTMTSNGSGYTAQPTIAWSGGAQLSAPSAAAEISTAGSTNNQTVLNAAGTGAVVLNGSNNSGTGGVVIGSGGPSETTVATINGAGSANFTGTLQVGGTSTFTGSTTVRNQADAEIDAILQAGLTAEQKESYVYRDHTGASQWYLVKDQNNNWALNSALSGIDSFKAYQSSNSGDTYVNASLPTGVVRVNYEPNSGAGMKIYGGGSSAVYASFTAPNAIQFPGLAAASGTNCVEIDNSGYLSNTGSSCGSGSGSGTVNSGATGQIAYYNTNGAAVSGISAIPVSAGGTGSTTASAALTALGAASLGASSAQSFTAPISAPAVTASVNSQLNVMAPPYNAKGDCVTDDRNAIQAALNASYNNYGNRATVYFPVPPGGCYLTGTLAYTGAPLAGQPTALATALGGSAVILRGKPGDDVMEVPDPTTTAGLIFTPDWSMENITFQVDDSAAGSFPHRWPGRWFDDGAMTAGSAVFKSPHAEMSCADVGQAIQVNGAGAGGANLVTTIASVTPCWAQSNGPSSPWQIVTLAASASTTVGNAHAYISILGFPVTTTIGACGIAFDDDDGNPANWAYTGGQAGIQGDGNTMRNVSFRSVSGASNGQNNSCGIYTQGVWGLYALDVKNFFIGRLTYGVVQGASELNSYYQSSANDYQKWDHGNFNLDSYPWISYNGGEGEMGNVELTTLTGPQFLRLGNRYFDDFNLWTISVPEFEGGAAGNGFTIVGNQVTLIDTVLNESPSATVHIDAQELQCFNCSTTGTLQLGGSHNIFQMYGDLSSTTVNDTGLGNRILESYLANPPFGMPLANRMAGNFTKGNGVQSQLTPDFVTSGNTGAVYPSAADLWFWPQDAVFTSSGATYASNIQPDSTSPTGYDFIFSGGNSFGQFSQFLLGPFKTANGALTAGIHFPATGMEVSLMAKCPAGTASFSPGFNLSGAGLIAPSAQSCSTGWQTYTFQVTGLSADSGQTARFGNAFNTATYYVAWFAIRPYQGDYNGYQPAHSGANSDITSITGLTAPLTTAQGGTGAGALTGYRYANGSGADTASATIPASALSNGTTGTGAVVLASGPTLAGNAITFANSAAAEQDVILKPGSTADQVGAYAFANFSGTTQWKLRKDASNFLRVTDAVNSLDREILFQNGQSILNAGAGANALVINGTANSGTGGLLVENGGSSPVAVLTVTGSGNTTATGFVAGKSMAGSGTMTLAAGAGAGTSPTIVCATSHVCDGISGTVSLTTGASPATGTLATLGFPNTHTNNANCVISVASSAAQLTSVTWSESPTAITLTANSALAASTAYQIRYWCGGN
ncbi:MAG TPA: hypothetical protein VE291_10690 [Terracidiphilus sp.]|nr:hypothetical protein [Terracidiphilus sp.]